jgi:hypothetical protein
LRGNRLKEGYIRGRRVEGEGGAGLEGVPVLKGVLVLSGDGSAGSFTLINIEDIFLIESRQRIVY